MDLQPADKRQSFTSDRPDLTVQAALTWSSPGDAAGHRYTFPDGFRLCAGKQAIIYTGDGSSYTTSTSTHLYWGREWYVWNNTGDKVILRRADGSLKDTCSYSGAGSKKYC
jgi:Lamin Tail Domain